MEGKTNSRENNFNIIRFMAAIMVMAGHMAYIGGYSLPILWGQGIQSLGVKIFFLIGGYLISKSWLSDPNPLRYSIKRIFRIFPALIIYTVIAAYVVGPLLSDLPMREYYMNPQVSYYLKNILLYPVYVLPGVFSNNPYPNAVNGSLWTLPVEVSLYILVPCILTLIGANKKNKKSFVFLIMITGLLCAAQILRLKKYPDWFLVIYGTDIASALELIPWYFIGMVFTYPCVQKKLNLQVASILLLCLSCLNANSVCYEMLRYIIFSYFIFSFSLAEKPYFSRMFVKHEISYGIYLYGFFVQQIIVFVFKKVNIAVGEIWLFLLSVIITIGVALISCITIEEPSQKIIKKIIKRI